MKELKELDLDDLQEVTGGTSKRKKCPYFLQALNKQAVNECKNCLYYNKVKGLYKCTYNKREESEFL